MSRRSSLRPCESNGWSPRRRLWRRSSGEIRARCEEAGLRPPSYVAIRARAAALFAAEEIAKRRSANPKHLRRLQPRPGYISAPRPLAVTQIDHTPTDIQFVEVIDGAGAFVGRAYLTILVDVFSRCILGFCLTLEAPSTALRRAVPRPRHLPQGGVARSARRRACLANVRTAESKS